MSSHVSVAESPPTQGQWAVSSLLILLTLLTTSLAGIFPQLSLGALLLVFSNPVLLLKGISYSFPVVIILLAHEMGHYFACRYYGMRCTPPYFIPLPIPITGTFGAFIKIKSHFPSRKALFDIGIAGPLAGFLFVLPTLLIGIRLSKLIPKGMLPPGEVIFGEPVILRLFGKILLGYSPAHHDMIAHPYVIAAWVGLLATSLNLLPIWQLDGGHISYAMIGRIWQKRLSVASLAALIFISLAEPLQLLHSKGLSQWERLLPPYLLAILLLLIIGFRNRFYHPSTMREEEGPGVGRFILGLMALLILIVSFMPVPIKII